MTISKFMKAALVSAALVTTAATAQAADEVNVVPGLSAAGAPVAVHGYDPVAYFTKGAPVRGSDTLRPHP